MQLLLQLKVLPLGILLLAYPQASGLATQKKVGRVITPTSFAQLHFFRTPLSIDKHIERVRASMDKVAEAISIL